MLKEITTTVEPTLEAVVRWCDTEHSAFYHEICAISRELADSKDATEKLVKKLNRKCRATKLGMALAIMAGVAYAIKNEHDKNELRAQIVSIDRDKEMDSILGTEAEVVQHTTE